jgi:hypothetical protein
MIIIYALQDIKCKKKREREREKKMMFPKPQVGKQQFSLPKTINFLAKDSLMSYSSCKPTTLGAISHLTIMAPPPGQFNLL